MSAPLALSRTPDEFALSDGSDRIGVARCIASEHAPATALRRVVGARRQRQSRSSDLRGAGVNAVEEIFVCKERAYNRRLLQMSRHYLVDPVACTPASGWEKGPLETQVGEIRPPHDVSVGTRLGPRPSLFRGDKQEVKRCLALSIQRIVATGAQQNPGRKPRG